MYKATSNSDHGTLYHIRNLINRRNVVKDPSKGVTACEGFFLLVVEAHILVATMQVFGMSSLDSPPSNTELFPAESSQLDSLQRGKILMTAVKEIIDRFVDLSLPTAPETPPDHDEPDRSSESQTKSKKTQSKGKSKDPSQEDHVPESQTKSKKTKSKSKTPLQEDYVPGPSESQTMKTKSKKTQSKGKSKAPSQGDHVPDPSESQTKSKKTKSKSKTPSQEDHASESQTMKTKSKKTKSKSKTPQKDHVKEYASEVLSIGLLLMEFIDAIREGDGLRNIRCWRFFLPIFKATNRTNYSIEAFNLLAQHDFVLPPRAKQQLMWERTINVSGVPGKNISCDLFMEHLNRQCKDAMGSLGSNINCSDSVTRIGRCLGELTKITDQYDRVNGVKPESDKHPKRSEAADLAKIVQELKTLSVFDSLPGREHKQFPKFISNPCKHLDVNYRIYS